MDLQVAVAASMLPASRSLIGSTVKELALTDGSPVLPAILSRLGFPPEAQNEVAALAMEEAAGVLRVGLAAGFRASVLGDPSYPALLACIPDPPPVLWMRGAPPALERPIVAIVGSRAASPYALEVAGRLGGELAGRGVTVASGLARGVDSAAHRGCLEAGGTTVGVLGSGLDRIYPSEHRDLAVSICKDGMIASELAPGAPPLPEHFPLRNRIISGISLAVVVVEASEKSGSLITARCALEQGRDVMAVPGSVLSGRNRGSHSLLKDGAKVVESADDILEGLGWAISGRSAGESRKPQQHDELLNRMDAGEAYDLETLAGLAGTTGPRLLPRLMELELLGLVRAAGGRFFRR